MFSGLVVGDKSEYNKRVDRKQETGDKDERRDQAKVD
jgi:hypothetical protein